jgi:mannitol-specific phosphotransferase system IIBC component
MLLWSVVVFVPGLPRFALVALLIAVAFAAGVFVLTFAWAKESVPARLGGTVSGIANMGVMLGGMVLQPLVGYVLDHRWQGRMANGMRAYDFQDYQWGFALILAWGVAALVLLAFTRETHCRQLR